MKVVKISLIRLISVLCQLYDKCFRWLWLIELAKLKEKSFCFCQFNYFEIEILHNSVLTTNVNKILFHIKIGEISDLNLKKKFNIQSAHLPFFHWTDATEEYTSNQSYIPIRNDDRDQQLNKNMSTFFLKIPIHQKSISNQLSLKCTDW